jgi:hypothetical protein
MSTGTYPFNWTFAEETVGEPLVDVPVVQQASPSRVELPIPVEVSSSSPSAEAVRSPEMNPPTQLEPPNTPRMPSPISQATMTNPTEEDPIFHQPETHESPMAASASPDLEVSALLGTLLSSAIAPAQENTHEVSNFALNLDTLVLAFSPRQCCFQDHTPSSSSLPSEGPSTADVTKEINQPLPDEVLLKLKEIAAWLEKDVQDQLNDLRHFEEMFEPISRKLPDDIRAFLSSVYDLEPFYVPLRRTWRKLRSRSAIEKEKTDAEQAMNGIQSQAKSHKDALADLQASYDLKVARKAALEAELKRLSAEMEIDQKKIADLPGLIAKTEAEAESAVTRVKQCDAELTDLSDAQKDYQEILDNSHLIVSNVRHALAKLLNA